MFELEETKNGPVANIKVVGVGGAGCNVVNNMVASSIRAVEFIAVNTDAQSLDSSLAMRRIQIGKQTTRGLGAGSNPAVGKDAANEDRAEIADALAGADMVFITSGMGGGTGTGAAPVVAEVARELGALTVAVVTKPFFYEGGRRGMNAERGIQELQERVDTLIVVPNDKISAVVEKGTSLLESFSVANNVLRYAVKGISDLILVPGLINLDFADVRAVMSDTGRAVIGMGIGSGESAAYEASKRAIANPLLEANSIEGASGILINITGGLELALSDIQDAATLIHESAAPDANIIMGAVVDPDIKDEVRVTVIATGFKEDVSRAQLPSMRKWAAVMPEAPRPAPAVAYRGAAAETAAPYRGAEKVLAKSMGVDRPRREERAGPIATPVAVGRDGEAVLRQGAI